MNEYAEVDRSQFPLVVVTFTGERETPENFYNYLHELYLNYEFKQPFTLVFDAEKASVPNAKYRQMQADWMATHETLIQKYCICVTYILPNPLFRHVLKLIFSIQDNPVPFKVFAKRAQGIAWARDTLNL